MKWLTIFQQSEILSGVDGFLFQQGLFDLLLLICTSNFCSSVQFMPISILCIRKPRWLKATMFKVFC